MNSHDEIELKLSSEYSDELRRALNSSETKFKSYFKQFSKFYAIARGNIWNDKLIPPQRDVDNIVHSILGTLQKHDIDIATVDFIPREIRDEIQKEAKAALEKPYKEATIQQAKQDMEKLTKCNKPIMWCADLTLLDKEREYYYDGEVSMSSKSELKVENGAFGELFVRMNPMHAVEHFGYDKSQYGYIQNVNIVDVTSNFYATTFITDKAIFVKCGNNDLYLSTMVNSYIDWLKEKGIETPNIGGRAGYDALVECYMQQLPEYQKQLSNPISEKYQFVRNLVDGMKENGQYMFLHNDGRMSINIMKRNGTENRKIMSDMHKGAVVISDENTPFINMETGEQIPEGTAFKVVDKIEIGSNTILVTDYAIISERDITKELGIAQSHNQELSQNIQDEQQIEEPEQEDIERT